MTCKLLIELEQAILLPHSTSASPLNTYMTPPTPLPQFNAINKITSPVGQLSYPACCLINAILMP